jgi:hypothetical protein
MCWLIPRWARSGRRAGCAPGCSGLRACHLLTPAGQVIGVQEAWRALPRRAVMLAFTIPAVAAACGGRTGFATKGIAVIVSANKRGVNGQSS